MQLGHSFRHFSPWSLDSIASGPLVGENPRSLSHNKQEIKRLGERWEDGKTEGGKT